MVNWANLVGDEIINVEPVIAEIRMFSVEQKRKKNKCSEFV